MRRNGRVADALLALLSRDWLGVPVAVLVVGVGAWLVGGGTGWLVALGCLVVTVGVVLAVGAVRHLVLVGRGTGAGGPPGRLVGVGGRRMHVLAEGLPGTGRRWSGCRADTRRARSSGSCTR